MERVTGFIEEESPKRETVIRALDECYDPCCRDRKISVVDMGLIESVEIQGGNVSIEMVLTSGWCPFAARLLEMIKEEVGKLPAVDAVDVEVVWDPTWTPERMSARRGETQAPAGEAGTLTRSSVERRERMIKDDVLVFDCVAHPFNFDMSNALGQPGEQFINHLYAFHSVLTPRE